MNCKLATRQSPKSVFAYLGIIADSPIRATRTKNGVVGNYGLRNEQQDEVSETRLSRPVVGTLYCFLSGTYMSKTVNVTMVVLLIVSHLITPVMLIWGWIRWAQWSKLKTIPSILSLSGFVLATGSAILAVSSIAYAQVHRLGFYDPSLMKIMRWGLMLSLAGFLFAVGGAWRRSSLRWHAPVCAFGTFAFWILAAEGE